MTPRQPNLRLPVTALILAGGLAALGAATPALAETRAEREARCTAQAEIVDAALTARSAGQRENRAIRDIARARADHPTPYREAIAVLTGWVWSLPADQLGDETRTQFFTACTGYAP